MLIKKKKKETFEEMFKRYKNTLRKSKIIENYKKKSFFNKKKKLRK
ncbi:hypothetical protein [Candidatus Vidania fulgoroideorum]